jgi:hypothetical protein
MPIAIKRPVWTKPSLKRLNAELVRLRARVENLKDPRDLNTAITRNAGKPGVPWAQAKKELGLA